MFSGTFVPRSEVRVSFLVGLFLDLGTSSRVTGLLSTSFPDHLVHRWRDPDNRRCRHEELGTRFGLAPADTRDDILDHRTLLLGRDHQHPHVAEDQNGGGHGDVLGSGTGGMEVVRGIGMFRLIWKARWPVSRSVARPSPY
jgi:hypothetical protein